MNAQTQPLIGREIHLTPDQLILSPHNVRQNSMGPKELDELAASILALGLINNLVVHKMPCKRGKQLYGVAAGGNRMNAINLLLSRALVDQTYGVRCIEVEESEALALSLSENVHRKGLNPVDELHAFRRMIEAGEAIEDIAAAFGVTPVVVERRLKLANVAPQLLDLYRTGDIKLDQLMALAVTDDHAAQIAVWDDLPDYNRHAATIRRALIGQRIDASRHPLVQFVGLDAYRAAGGAVDQDLFSDAENAGFITDGQLLDKLAQARLDAELETVRAEGWAWCETRLRLDTAEYNLFATATTERREPTTEEAQRLEQLDKDLDALENEYSEWTPEYQEKLDPLEAEQNQINDGLHFYTDAAKAVSGVIVTIDSDGELEINRGLIRPEDRKAAAKAEPAKPAKAAKKKGAHSEALTRRLTAHRTLALQAAVAQRPDVALALLAYRLVSLAFYPREYGAGLVQVRTELPGLSRDADDLAANPAQKLLNDQHKSWKQKLPKKHTALLAWLLEQPQAELLNLVALCTATTLNTVQNDDQRQRDTDALAAAVALDMADWWQPTPAGYLNHIKKDAILNAVKEAVTPAAAQALEPLKKDQLVKAASEKLAGTRWIPALLRSKK